VLSDWVNRHPSVTLLGITHTSKRRATDDLDNAALDLVQNTTGITAGADTVLVMARADGIMTLYRSSRDLEDTEPLRIRIEKSTMRWGINDTVVEMTAREAVLNTLEYMNEPVSVRLMADFQGKTSNAIRQACLRLLHEPKPLIGASKAGYYLLERSPTNKKNGAPSNIVTPPCGSENEEDRE
jgi:hypothetical protein